MTGVNGYDKASEVLHVVVHNVDLRRPERTRRIPKFVKAGVVVAGIVGTWSAALYATGKYESMETRPAHEQTENDALTVLNDVNQISLLLEGRRCAAIDEHKPLLDSKRSVDGHIRQHGKFDEDMKQLYDDVKQGGIAMASELYEVGQDSSLVGANALCDDIEFDNTEQARNYEFYSNALKGHLRDFSESQAQEDKITDRINRQVSVARYALAGAHGIGLLGFVRKRRK